MEKSSISVIILTYNEELHIRRCIENVKRVTNDVFVVDCFSTDKTVEIARKCGAVVFQHAYVNQAQQFQWALDNCPAETEWVMRLDADEYLTDELIDEIERELPRFPSNVNGVYFPFRVSFLGKILRFGHLHPVRIMRLWRKGKVYMEQRWMDERIVLREGDSVMFKHCFIDDNLNGLTAWTQKHNVYSNREVLVELNRRYGFLDSEEEDSLKSRNQKKTAYYRFPRFFRALGYFAVRYLFFLGFLDGTRGLIWHTLQAYWYRFLVDSKLYEVEKHLGKNPTKEQLVEYFSRYYGIKL